MKKLKVFLVIFFAGIIFGIGSGITTVFAYNLPVQNGLIGILTLNASSKKTIKSEALYDWDEIMAPILSENYSIRELLQKFNNGFREWVLEDEHRFRELLTHPTFESADSFIYNFLKENPEYRDYIKQYVDMLTEIHRSMVPTFSQAYCDMIVEEGKVIDQREYNTTINGTEFIVTCELYELSINGTAHRLMKANFYNSEGVLIADPYAGVYIYFIPMYIWPLGWYIIGEDLFFNVRYTYPNESNTWYTLIQAEIHLGDPNVYIETILRLMFPPVVTIVGGGRLAIINPLVALFSLFGTVFFQILELQYFDERTDYAWTMSSYDNWGIQTQIHCHFIYPWTLFSFLSSYYMVGYVLYNGAYVPGLPNPYTHVLIPLITVGGVLAYLIINAWNLVNLRDEIWEWGAYWGMYQMIWFGT